MRLGPIATIMIPIMFLVLIGGIYFHLQEWFRLRNGCDYPHDWVYHPWNTPNHRQVRWCDKCGIRQVRLADGYMWGPAHV